MSNGYRSRKLPNSTAYQPKLFEDGLILGKFPLGELLRTKDNLKSVQKQILTMNEQITSMFEFLLSNRKTILKDKKLFYLTNSQTIKLSKTLAPDSTTTEKDYSPFWNESKKILSDKLWLPQEIVSFDLDLNYSNGYVTNAGPRSWFSSKMMIPRNPSLLQNFWTSSKFFAVGEMDAEDTVTKSLKIRILLKPHQKKLLEEWAHSNRYTYNMAIESIQNDSCANKLILRNKLVTGKNLSDGKDWLLKTPKVVRQQAVFRAAANWSSAQSNLKTENIKKFSFQKKKSNLWTLGIEKQISVEKDGKMTMFKGKSFNFGSFQAKDRVFKGEKAKIFPFQESKKGLLKPKQDSFIHKDQFNRYYLITPYTVEKKQIKQEKLVSLDPGLRKFLAAYSPDGECSYLGVNCRDRLWELMKKMDSLDQLLGLEINCSKRKNLRKRKRGIYRKMADLRDELHNKIIKWLVSNYGTILLGKLDVSDIVAKEKRVLRAKEVRSILSLSHFKFRTKLAHRCKEEKVRLLIVNEAWTSKTCTGYGKVNCQLGGEEVYSCGECGVTIDRDLNGARNILLKNTGELTV